MIADPPYTEVRFTLPYSLPFEGEFSFDWADDTFWVKVENVQVFDARSEEVTGFQVVTTGGGEVTVRGPHGLSHLARVVVRFRASLESEGPAGSELRDPDTDEAREHACEGINRVIEVYREATNDFRVKRVMPQQDVISLDIELVEEGGGGTTGFALGSKKKKVYPLAVLDLEHVRPLIDELLRDQVPVLVWKDYIHAARRFFEEREFALAVVLGNAALELLWAHLLRITLTNRGLSEDDVKQRLDRWTSPTATRGTITLLDEGFQEVFERSLRAENEKLWVALDEARTLRKNVIHPWPKKPERDETFRAMVAIEAVVAWLLQVVSDDAESQARRSRPNSG